MHRKIISIHSRKGGVTKTVTAYNLAAFFALRGLRILALDIDSQANLSKLLARGKPTGKKLIDIISSGLPIKPADVSTSVLDAAGHKIDYIAASLGLTSLETKIPDDLPKEYFLKDLLTDIATNYDVILIDTPPTAELGSQAALMAANEVVIPATPDMLGVDGAAETMAIVKRMQSRSYSNPDLKVAGILVTRKDAHRVLSEDNAVSALRNAFGSLVVPTMVRRSDSVNKSLGHFLPVITYMPDSGVAQDYTKAFTEMFPDL